MTSSIRIITCVALFVGFSALANAKCSQSCTLELNPLCARNNKGETQIFGNPCLFDSARCKDPSADWVLTANGRCVQVRKDCPKICTLEWRPVCGKNDEGEYVTFENPCKFETAQCSNPSAGWTRTRNGVCAEVRKECPAACTDDWSPVCGKNFDGKYITFANPCEFEIAQCQNPSAGWTQTRNGVCAETREDCPKICTLEWRPVCGKNDEGRFVTFSNLCQFESAQCSNPSAGWTRTRNGVCAEVRKECPAACTDDWSPVCGKNFDGKYTTFANPCEFEIAQCQNPSAGWTQTRNGVCAETREDCPKICTLEWKPVCGKNHEGKYVTFGNLCQFESIQCSIPSAGWTRTRNGECAEVRKECPTVCIAEWNPVCAKTSDNRYATFGNLCEFEYNRIIANQLPCWTRTRNGACAETRKECPKICTAEWAPICAKNYKGEFETFGNTCLFEVAQCENPSAGWVRTKSGAC